jgi:DNA (cytosine-5)-methyltransferase 1
MKKAFKPNLIAAVDLFCGVGGLTYGLKRAGIDVNLGIDIDSNCRFPFEANNQTRFSEKSVSDVTAEELFQAWGDAPYSLLAGCAPCQPFSNYSQGTDHSKDKRWRLLLEFARLVRSTKPDFVTIENVPQLQRQGIFSEFVRSLEDDGFEVSHQVVDCSEYGVPQQRHRMVLLASRHGKIKMIPASRRYGPTTVKDAIGDLPRLEAGGVCKSDPLHQASGLSPLNLQRILASKPGGTWRDWPRQLLADCHTKSSGKGYAAVYGRMEWDQPSPTMTTQFFGFGSGRFGHPEQNRGITLREGAILQSFPKKYKFVEPGRSILVSVVGRLIGNAVPVKLAEAIGKSVLAHVAEIRDAG